MNNIDDFNIRYSKEKVKQQLLADLDAYKMWVEEDDWDKAEDAALNCYEILRAFLDDGITTWVNNNKDLLINRADILALESYENLGGQDE